MKQIRITLEPTQQLSTDFLEMFSRLINNNSEGVLGLRLEEAGSMSYSEFNTYLQNCLNLKQGYKSPTHKRLSQYSFHFESKANIIVLLLDLSPYMLQYNYGTHSFPLDNLQEVAVHLMRQVAARQARNPQYHYKLSIYFFSLFEKDLQMIMFQEEVTQQSCQLLCDFLAAAVKKSKLPYLKSNQKYSVGEIIQGLFNGEETTIGIKSIITLSSFHEEETSPLLLFTPNWYTYAFVNTGGHFGSFHISNQQLKDKVMISQHFRSKYIYQTVFLDNWAMTQALQEQNPQLSTPVTNKGRNILFQQAESTITDIFKDLLTFKISFSDFKRRKTGMNESSVMSGLKDNGRAVHKSYRIASQDFMYILRSKYVQGWEPLMVNSTLVENTKYRLRLPVEGDNYLYYEAIRSKGDFIISIYQQSQKHQGNAGQMAALIERSDLINSANFSYPLRGPLKMNRERNTPQWLQSSQQENIDYLCINRSEWGRFLKLKKVCFRFTPTLTSNFLNEFLQEIHYLIGKRVVNNVFMKQFESHRKMSERADRLDQSTQRVNRRVLLTKVNQHGNIIELELGFLRFNYQEINNLLESLTSKPKQRRFKYGTVQSVSGSLVSTLRRGMIEHALFSRRWTLAFTNKWFRYMFGIYWRRLLSRTGYEQVHSRAQFIERLYYKIINVRAQDPSSASNSSMSQKIILLHIRVNPDKEEALFRLSLQPCLLRLQPLESQGKAISLVDLVAVIEGELKGFQKELIQLIETYMSIHNSLLRYCLKARSIKLFNATIRSFNSDFYDISQVYFRNKFNRYLSETLKKYYDAYLGEETHCLPEPSHHLTTTDLQTVQGDLQITINGRVYTFFLCTPFTMLYLQKRDKSLYYKFVYLFYQQYNPKEGEKQFEETVLKELNDLINQQTYFRDFKVFLEGNFKGGIAKIIDNQKFTQIEKVSIDLSVLLVLAQKFGVSKPDPSMEEWPKLMGVFRVYARKMMAIVREFFPLLRVRYFFQLRQEHSQAPFGIETDISRVDSELFMRMLFILDEDENSGVDVTQQNIPQLLMEHYDKILDDRAKIFFTFYLKAKDASSQSKGFVEYFEELMSKLSEQTAYEVEMAVITNKETLTSDLDELAFFSGGSRRETLRLQLIREQATSIDYICKQIESLTMQAILPFQRVKVFPAEYVAIQKLEEQGLVLSAGVLSFTVQRGVIHIFFRPTTFYLDEQQLVRKSLHIYIDKLKNYINGSILMKQLLETLELPYDPSEMWLSESANSRENLIIEKKKKKVTKAPVSRFISKLRDAKEEVQQQTSSIITVKVPLNSIYKGCIALNERIPPGQGLMAVQQFQIFSICKISNMNNTFLFEKIGVSDPVIFNFEQKEEDEVIRQLVQPGLSKRYLLYQAFCVNPSVKRQKMDPMIRGYINQAINRKLFDQMCHYLRGDNRLLSLSDEAFIRGEKKEVKEFRYQVPSRCDMQILEVLISQQIEVYHYPVDLKSQQKVKQQRELNMLDRFIETQKRGISESTKVQSSTDNFFKEPTLDKKHHSSRQVNLQSSMAYSQTPKLSTEFSLKGSERPLKSSEVTIECNFEYYQQVWLFNCMRSKYNLIDIYGKSLYLLRLKGKEDPTSRMSQQSVPSNKIQYLFPKLQGHEDLFEIKKMFAKGYSGKVIKRQSIRTHSVICFEIADYVGNPKWAEIESTLLSIWRGSLTDYYLQNYLFQESLQVARMAVSEDSPQMSWMTVIDWLNQIHGLVESSPSLLFSRFKSQTDIYVKDPYIYFEDFINQLLVVVGEISKQPPRFPLLIYCHDLQQKYHFWLLRGNLLTILQQMVGYNPTNIGVILTDYLPRSLLADTEAGCDFSLLQHFKDISIFEDYFIKRSLFVYYEITKQNFTYGSYNLQSYVDREIKDYLGAIHCWLAKKMHMYRLIRNIKEKGVYDLDRKKMPQKLKVPFFELRYVSEGEDKQEHKRKHLSLYRLMVNLVFNQFPQDGSIVLQSQKDGESIKKARKKVKYLHHCIQFGQMIQILKKSKVNYSLIPPYQGNQKCILEKVGREYITLLRIQHRVQS